MKVILLQDVAKIGKRSQLVEVPDGYARNQLIPKGMAEAATAVNKKRIERMQAEAESNAAQAEANYKKSLEALRATPIKIEAAVNEEGGLFKAVSEKDIAEAAGTAGVEVSEAMLLVGEPIKSVGEHEVTLVYGEQKETFTIEVIKQSE